MIHSKICYNRALSIFESRLEMKHLLYSTYFRKMDLEGIIKLLNKEIIEMREEIDKKPISRPAHIVEEAADIMICALMIMDKTLGGLPF